jgi:hypothetical protein
VIFAQLSERMTKTKSSTKVVSIAEHPEQLSDR